MENSRLFPTLAVVLAAGHGSRMHSRLPKVLHEVGHRPLLGHVLSACQAAGIAQLAVVVGPDTPQVAAYVQQQAPAAQLFIQQERLGTAHAALAARAALAGHEQGCVLVLFGDTPLLSAHTLQQLRQTLIEGAAVAVAGFRSARPGPYGRLLLEDGQLVGIREARDASPEELAIDLCNGGVMGFRADHALWLLERIGCLNAQGEYYLTDAVALAHAAGLPVRVVEVGETEVLGVNDRAQLQEAEQLFQQRRRDQALQAGVTLADADTVYFSADTELAADVCVEPCVVFGPGVRVGPGARIAAFSRLEQVEIGVSATLSPGA